MKTRARTTTYPLNLERFARAGLMLYLALSPLVLSVRNLEVFEFPKAVLLVFVAVILLGFFAARLARHLRSDPARGLSAGSVKAAAMTALRQPLVLGVLLYLLSATVSTVLALNVRTALLGAHNSYEGWVTIAAYVVLFFAIRAFVRTREEVRMLLAAPLFTLTIISVYSLLQAFGFDPLHWQRTSSYGSWIRPFATLGNPNFLGAFLVTALPFAVLAGLELAAAGRRWGAYGIGAVVLLALVDVVLTLSRATWVALAASVIVTVWMTRTHSQPDAARKWSAKIPWPLILRLACLFVVAGLIIFAAMGSTTLASRIGRFGDFETRLEIWKCAARMFVDHPLSGEGLDCFQLGYQHYRQPAHWQASGSADWGGTPTNSHNIVLHVLATQGLFGFIALLVLAYGLILEARQALHRHQGRDRRVIVALLASITGFVVQDLANFIVVGCGTLFVTSIAMLHPWTRPAEPETSDAWRPAEIALLLGAAGLAFLARFYDNVRLTPLADTAIASSPVYAISGLLIVTAVLAGVWLGVAYARLIPQNATGPRSERGVDRRVLLAQTVTWLVIAGLVGFPSWLFPGQPTYSTSILNGVLGRVYVADMASREGSNMLTTPMPAAPLEARRYLQMAVSLQERATELDATRDVLFANLATARHRAAHYADLPLQTKALLESAEDAGVRACELVPQSAPNWSNLALLRRCMATTEDPETPGLPLRQKQTVLQAIERAVAVDPTNPIILVGAAQTCQFLGDSQQALDYARRATALYPDFGLALRVEAFYAYQEGQYEDAVRMLKTSLDDRRQEEVEGRARAYVQMAAALTRLGRYDEALAAAYQGAAECTSEEAVALPAARYYHAQALALLGRKAEATAEYESLLHQHPQLPVAQNALRVLSQGEPVVPVDFPNP